MVPLNVRYRSRRRPAPPRRRRRARSRSPSPAYADLLAARPPADVVLVDDLRARRASSSRVRSTPRDRQRAVHLRHDRATPRAACSRTATGPRLAGSLVEEFPRIDADDVMLTAQPFHYLDPHVERRDRADGRRPPGRARRLPPLDLLGPGARARGDLLLLPGGDADAAAADAARPDSTATTGCARCSARRSRRRCTPSSRSAGACRGSRRSG